MSRRFFIGDVHGCLYTLQALIRQLNITKQDSIRFCGDLIDRGISPKGVIDYIREHQADGFDWISVKGNHEQMLIDTEKGRLEELQLFLQNGGDATLKSFNNNIPEDYMEWFKSLPEYLIEEDVILVHAGFDFYYADPIQHMIDDVKSQNHLWTRMYTVRPETLMGKMLITGHTPTCLEEILNPKSYHIKLDNYAHGGSVPRYVEMGYGNLVAYELNSEKFFVQPNVEGV